MTFLASGRSETHKKGKNFSPPIALHRETIRSRRDPRPSLSSAVVLLALGLLSCSGGGGGTSPPLPPTPPLVITVSVVPGSTTAMVGTDVQFVAIVANASNTAVDWQVNANPGGNSTVGTISALGHYRAPDTPPNPATVMVTATSQADRTKSATARVTILAGPTNVAVSPRRVVLTVTQSQQFQVTAQNIGNPNVNWAVDGIPGGNAAVGTISASGLYMPPAASGLHNVTATSVADSTQSDTAAVVVSNYPGTFTWRNDSGRTGQNRDELWLSVDTVNQAEFGKLFSYPVDGYIYAQPLYAANLQIPGRGFHNVVYVATQHDSVYAFDADGRSSSPLWQVSLINPAAGITTVPSDDVGSTDIIPEIGITGTPVIDTQTGTLYVVAKTKENGAYFQRLHALDIFTGAEKFGGPVVIQASIRGTGDGGDGQGNIPFNALIQNQRPGLLLLGGTVYLGFASHGDNGPYHGWLLGYDAATLRQVAVFNDTPDGFRGGIWQAGGAPSADSSGHIFITTGNGTFDRDTGGADSSDSMLKLNIAGGLTVADYFTPFNQDFLNGGDLDLGSTSLVVLPDQTGTSHPHLLLGGGKEGKLYLVDRDAMGNFHIGDDSQIVQSLLVSSDGIFGTPAIWENNVYVSGLSNALKAFQLSAGKLSTSPVQQGDTVFGFPGGQPAVSSNGSTNGIVWVLQTDAFGASGPAVLRAYDATNVSVEIYDSNLAGARDQPGPAVKFTVPTVANGKVFVGTQNQLTVFGPLP